LRASLGWFKRVETRSLKMTEEDETEQAVVVDEEEAEEAEADT
jgi:hypothetical protein